MDLGPHDLHHSPSAYPPRMTPRKDLVCPPQWGQMKMTRVSVLLFVCNEGL